MTYLLFFTWKVPLSPWLVSRSSEHFVNKKMVPSCQISKRLHSLIHIWPVPTPVWSGFLDLFTRQKVGGEGTGGACIWFVVGRMTRRWHVPRESPGPLQVAEPPARRPAHARQVARTAPCGFRAGLLLLRAPQTPCWLAVESVDSFLDYEGNQFCWNNQSEKTTFYN